MADPSPGSDKARRVILLIDEDAAIGRLVRLSMHGPTCQVIVCNRHLEGLRLAARQKPHLIVMETQFKGADGLALASKLQQAPETRGSALFFLTAETSVVSRFHGMQLGALDYAQKPVDGRTLARRIDAAMARLDEPRRSVVGPAVGPLLNHLRQAEEAGSSGVLELQRGGEQARIVLGFGVVSRAECGELAGEEALNEIASRGDWSVAFHAGAQPEADAELGEVTDPTAEPLRGRRDTSELTRPEVPSRPIKHVSSALAATVADAAVAQPRSGPQPAFSVKPAVAVPNAPPIARKGTPTTPQPVKGLPTVPTTPAMKVPSPPSAPPVEPARDMDPSLLRFEMSAEEDATIVDPQPGTMMDAPTRENIGQPVPEILITAPTAPHERQDDTEDFNYSTDAGAKPPDVKLMDDGFYDEDMPTGMSFKAADIGSVPDATASEVDTAPGRQTQEMPQPAVASSPSTPLAPSGTPVPGRESLRQWLAAEKVSTLLLAMRDREARRLLQGASEELGFRVHAVNTGVEAYTTALRVRPVALVSDLRAPELDGRELLAAVRSDFHVRETPFIIVSADYLRDQVKAMGESGLGQIMHGLEAALAPRVTLHGRLRPDQGEISGHVEAVGISYLLRALGRAALSGRLALHGVAREGEVIFRRGEICGVTTKLQEPTVGPLAVLHVLGLEWQDYTFHPDVVDGGQVPLGDLGALIETACQQNNIFLARLYQLGVRQEDVVVDKQALDSYLDKLAPGSLELLVRLIEGERAAALQEQGVAAPALLKTVLHDLRRKALVVPTSMRPVRVETDRQISMPVLPARRPGGHHWVVVLLAGLLTVLVAAGGYLLYRRVIAPRLQRPPAAAPGAAESPPPTK